jgi:hypothetical protein
MTNDGGEQLFQILSYLRVLEGTKSIYNAGSIAQNIINDIKSILDVIRIGYNYK